MKLTATSLRTLLTLPIAALLVGAAACGGEAEDDGTAAAAISGGTPVTMAFENANTYVRSVVQISRTSGGITSFCSATKIDAKRYLTAGHCLAYFPRGASIKISNTWDSDHFPTVSKTFLHPSWRKVSSQVSSYDIGIIEVNGVSSIPIWNSFDYSFVPDTRDNSAPYRLVAFGFSDAACTTGNGVPQWADLQSWSRSASPNGRYWDGIYSHNVMEYNAPSGCFGDSGGPLFNKATGNIVGVANAIVPHPTNPPTIFTRIDQLQSFIQDPLSACRNGCDAECLDKITSTDSAAFYPQCFDQCVNSNC